MTSARGSGDHVIPRHPDGRRGRYHLPVPVQHHLRLGPDELAGNGELGRYVFLPGDPSRAGRIAERFDDARAIDNPRGLDAWLGRLPGGNGDEPVDVLAVASGIGAGSTEVVVHELLACGARRLLRVGSCGSMSERIRPGQVVLAVAAVRDEAASGHYAPPEYPAVAHPDVLAALSEGARRAGLAAETFRGICHSKASLFAREFGHGPAGERNRRYREELTRAGVVASEMEASTLFVLASAAGPWCGPLDGGWGEECQAGAVLAVFGTDQSNMKLDPELPRLAERRAIDVAVEGTRVWARRERLANGGAAAG
jgi:uridine phosphorylase